MWLLEVREDIIIVWWQDYGNLSVEELLQEMGLARSAR
jgi:hypothetical protein